MAADDMMLDKGAPIDANDQSTWATDLPAELREAGFLLPPPKVIIGNISAGHLVTGMVTGLIESLMTGTALTCALGASGPYLDDGRNRVVSIALDVDGWDWLLFIDSDVEFTAADISTLLLPTRHVAYPTATLPVIGGVYVNPYPDNGVRGEEDDQPNSHVGPVCYDWELRDDLDGMDGKIVPAFRRVSRSTLEHRSPYTSHDGHLWNLEDKVCRVDAIGTGMMAIHRSLLNRLMAEFEPPCIWFDEPVVNGVHLGEDLGFCHRLGLLGYPVLANRACHPLHHHTLKLI